jgi:hypothetical protein
MRALFRQPPRLVFHLAVVPLALLLLYALSFPGVSFLALAAAGLGLFAAAALWSVRVLTYVLALRRGTAGGSPGWLLVAPLGGLLLFALVLADVPLRARWAVSKPAFERVASGGAFDGPARLGTYDVVSLDREGAAVVFTEATGSFFDDAGFAYLPDGPFRELEDASREDMAFQPLGDGWYAWTSGW